jgi:CDGSH-type Zn-finger protein
VSVIDAEGNRLTVPKGPVALCGCGHSQTKPFCDASLRAAGSRSCVRAQAQVG